MDDDARRPSLSLIPYPADSREIVLQHGSAVVVYDEVSKQLSLRDTNRSDTVDLVECPYCHRPLHEVPPKSARMEPSISSLIEPDVLNSGYFRMLQHSREGSQNSSGPPSSRWRLVQSAIAGADPISQASTGDNSNARPTSPSTTKPISSSAFSQNYFKTFFVEERELGRGGRGVVLLVTHVLDGVNLGQFACKRVPVGDDHEWLEKCLIEVKMLQSLSHPHLVSYRHVWLEDYGSTQFGPQIPTAFILQQYCNAGDLHNYIMSSARSSVTKEQLKDRMRTRSKGQLEPPLELLSPRRMQLEDIAAFFKDITSGVNHLHANGFVHRDLKPSNCLLHRTGQKVRVLVSDFGEMQGVDIARKSTGSTGTISYCAPEVLRRGPDGHFSNFTQKSDVFSLGMIVYFMCFSHLPYKNADNINEESEDLDQLREEITLWTGVGDDLKSRSDLPDMLHSFLKRILSVDPNERPSTSEILQSIKAGSAFNEHNAYGPVTSSGEVTSVGSRLQTGGNAPYETSANRGELKRRISPTVISGGAKKRRSSGEDYQSTSTATYQETIEQTASSAQIVPREKRFKALMAPPVSSRRRPMEGILDRPSARLSVKVLVFSLKIFSCLRPCHPLAAKPRILYPLLGLAALDLTDLMHGPARSIVPLLLHLSVIALASHFDELCESNPNSVRPNWEAPIR